MAVKKWLNISFWSLFSAALLVTSYLLFQNWSSKKDAIQKAVLYDQLQESLTIEKSLVGLRLDDWEFVSMENEPTSLLSTLQPNGYTIVIFSSLEACSACREQELALWQEHFASSEDAKGRLFLVLGESFDLDEMVLRRMRSGAKALPITFPRFIDRGSIGQMALGLTSHQTPAVLLLDSNGTVLKAYHPTSLTIERSKSFVEDVLEIIHSQPDSLHTGM